MVPHNGYKDFLKRLALNLFLHAANLPATLVIAPARHLEAWQTSQLPNDEKASSTLISHQLTLSMRVVAR